MKKQSGFTLIELIVVMVILGILAAVALPKFVSLSSDARIAKMKGAAAAVQSAAVLIHAKWLVTQSSPVAYEGGSATIVNGYPNAASIAPAAGITSPDFSISGGTIRESAGSACLIVYAPPASAGGAPTVDQSAVTAANCP